MVALDDQTIVMKAELLTSSPDLKYSEGKHLNCNSATYTIRYSCLGVTDERLRGKDTDKEKHGYQNFATTIDDANFHLVIEGTSFHVVRNDFPDLYQKVHHIESNGLSPVMHFEPFTVPARS